MTQEPNDTEQRVPTERIRKIWSFERSAPGEPVQEQMEITEEVDGVTENTTEVKFRFAGTGEAITSPDQVFGECVVGGELLTRATARRCANDQHHALICPEHSQEFGGDYYCPDCARAELVKRLVAFGILAACLITGIVLLIKAVF